MALLIQALQESQVRLLEDDSFVETFFVVDNQSLDS